MTKNHNNIVPAASWKHMLPSMVLIFLYFAMFVPPTSPAQAQTPRLLFSKKIKGKRTTTYQVQKGDYLYAIIRAQGYPEKQIPAVVRRIQKLNPSIDLTAPIHPGQTLRIPASIDSHAATRQSEKTKKKQTGKTPLHTTAVQHYTFQSGDSLFKVLRGKTGLDTRQITSAYLPLFLAHNPQIKDIDLIRKGQTVVLPPYSSTTKSTPQLLPFSGTDPSSAFTENEERLTPEQGRQYTRAFLEGMGFSFTRGKKAFFPRPQTGWVRINLEKTPIATTPWGTSLLLIPKEAKTSTAQDPEQGGLFPCIVPDDWNPYKVIHAIARAFPEKLSIHPLGVLRERRQDRVHISLQANIMVDAAWADETTLYCLQIIPQEGPVYPVLLSSLLENSHISLMQWHRNTDKHLVPVRQRLVRAEDIYVPTVTREQLHLLAPNSHGSPRATPGLPPVPENIPRPTRISLDWGQKGQRIAITADVLGLKTEDQQIILLDPVMKSPYLIALLGMQGLDCYALLDAPAITHP